MTSSQWLDLAVLAVAFVAAISGWRSGALGSLLSFVGVVLGAVAGVLLAPHVVGHIDGPRTKLFVTLFLILGARRHRRDRGRRAGPRGARRDPQRHAAHLRLGDRRGAAGRRGAGRGVAAGVTPLQSSDQPNLAAAVRGSTVLAAGRRASRRAG